MSNPYPQSHYHPDSKVSVEEMDSLYTALDDEQAAIVAHAKLVGKQRTYRMPVGQHPAEVAALLDAAKASLTNSRMIERDLMSRYINLHVYSPKTENTDEYIKAYRYVGELRDAQIAAHL